jgi:hypothetical protein
MSEKADFEPSLKRASHFVKIIVACPHRLPKLPESTLRKQARPNNGSLFYSHCGLTKAAQGPVIQAAGTWESRSEFEDGLASGDCRAIHIA